MVSANLEQVINLPGFGIRQSDGRIHWFPKSNPRCLQEPVNDKEAKEEQATED